MGPLDEGLYNAEGIAPDEPRGFEPGIGDEEGITTEGTDIPSPFAGMVPAGEQLPEPDPRLYTPAVEQAQAEEGILDDGGLNLTEALGISIQENSVTFNLLDMAHGREHGGPTEGQEKVWTLDEYSEFAKKWGVDDHPDREQFLDFVTAAQSDSHANSLAREWLLAEDRRQQFADLPLAAQIPLILGTAVMDPISVGVGGPVLAAAKGVKGTAAAVTALGTAEQAIISANQARQDETEVALVAGFSAILGIGIGKLAARRAGTEALTGSKHAVDEVAAIQQEGVETMDAFRKSLDEVTDTAEDADLAALGKNWGKESADEVVELSDDIGAIAARSADDAPDAKVRLTDTPASRAADEFDAIRGGVVKMQDLRRLAKELGAPTARDKATLTKNIEAKVDELRAKQDMTAADARKAAEEAKAIDERLDDLALRANDQEELARLIRGKDGKMSLNKMRATVTRLGMAIPKECA